MPRDFDRDKRFRGDDKKSKKTIGTVEDFLDKLKEEEARKLAADIAAAAARGLTLEQQEILEKYGTLDPEKMNAKRFGKPLERQHVGPCTPISVAEVEQMLPVFWDENDNRTSVRHMRWIREQELEKARAFEAAGLVAPGHIPKIPYAERVAMQTVEESLSNRAALAAAVPPDSRQYNVAREMLGDVKRRQASEQLAPTPRPVVAAGKPAPLTRKLEYRPITAPKDRVPAAVAVSAPSAAAAPVQMKADVADSAMSAADVREAAALGTVGSGHTLPFIDQLQKAFGRDLTGIKAHTDSSAAAGAAAMGAKAYATGNNVVLGENPDLHTVAHEVAHVLQQQAGVSLSSGVGAVGDDYERAADAIADRVVAGQSAVDLLPGAQSASPGFTQLQSMLRAGDQPRVSAVSSLLADFPAEREAMMAELRGNVSPKFVASLAKVRSDSGLAAAQQPRPVAAAPIVSTSVAVPIVPAIQSAGIEPDTGRSRAVQKKETTAKATTAATTEGDYGALTLPTAAMTQGQVHSWITTQIGKHGLAKLRLLVQVQQGPTKAKILEEMDSLLPQALSLSKTFRRNADRAAHDLLDASERGIVAALAPYGQFSLEKLRVVGKTIALKGDGMTESLVNGLMNTAQTAQPGAAMRPTDDKAQAPKDPAGQLQQRQALQEAAQELSGLHRRVSQLQQQMMEAGACAPKRESDHERKARSGNVATHALPASASLPQMPGADFAASSGASATAQPPKPADFAAATAQYESAQAQLRTRWQELEQQHPALVAYRAGNGHSLDALGASKDGNQALRHLLHAVVPKLGNIVKTRSGLDNDVNPLTLPSVVALTKQRMGITDGSLRSGLLIDPIADANSAGWKDYAVAAVTVGAMVITAVSTAGTSLLIGAELVGLAASVYGATDALGTFQQQKALSNTDLDRAKSMSLAEPSLFWLAAALVGIPLSAAAAVKVFQQAVRLRRASAAARQLQAEATSSAAAVKQLNAGTETASEAVQEVRVLTAELDAVGEANGLGRLGERVVLEPFSGPNLDSARDLAQKHPGAKVIATESNHMPSADEIATFRAEGGEFLAERFAESLPPGSVDKIYVRYPLPHGKAMDTRIDYQKLQHLIAEEISLANGKLAWDQAFNRVSAKLLPPAESMTNFGPHALEKLAPGGTIEIVFWEKEIANELQALTASTYMNATTGQQFRLQIDGGISLVSRETIAPYSGYGIPEHIKLVSVATMRKVVTP